MTDTEKIEELKKRLKKPIEWYEKNLKEEGQDYVYDCLYEEFENLSRGDYVEIIRILIT